MADSYELLKGTIDMHVHSGPGLVPRGYDHVQVIRAAIESGMRAIVIKDQHLPSGNVCKLLQQYFVNEGENFNVFGSLILNNAVGGINPSAVEFAMGFGTKVFWMPVISSQYSRERLAWMRDNVPGYNQGLPKTKKALRFDPDITVLDSCGKLLPEVPVVCKLIADGDAVLATGHLSKKETDLVLNEAVKQGVKKIVITHPEFFREYSTDEMKDFELSGFYVEHILATMYSGKTTYDGLFEMISEHYCGRTFICTDLGQPNRPLPSEGMRIFIDEMLNRGMSEEQIRTITSTNQKYLLGLE